MQCDYCGTDLPAGANLCPACGAEVEINETIIEPEMVLKTSGFGGSIKDTNDTVILEDNKMTAGLPRKGVGFFAAVGLFFKNFFNFRGRASRSEFWWGYLFVSIVFSILAALSDSVQSLSQLFSLLDFVLIIGELSLIIRRFHDTGKSWLYIWWGVLPVVGFIMWFVAWVKPSAGTNQWGKGPEK